MKKLYYLIILTVILGLVLTGCLLSNVGQVPTNEQSGISYLTKGGPTVDDADEFDLYAGQDWLVGKMLVWDDGTQLCVKYQLFDGTGGTEDVIGEGWGITETHLAVATCPEDIPQTKKGNPIPGQFLYGDDELEGVAFYQECIPFDELGVEEPGDLDVECGDDLVIAAHAVIEKEECIPGDTGTDAYVSDETTMVIAGNTGITTPHAAVPTNAGAHYGANTWINQTGSDGWYPTPPTPTWIWESNPVVNPIDGDIVWFEKTFDVTGTPTAGELKIAVDNAYAVWLNGKFVGSDNLFLFVGADDNYDTTMLGDLKQAYVDTTTWQTVGMFNLTPYLQTGNNTLKILGVNEYMNPDDGGQPEGTTLSNPGGMAFQFTVDWEVPEVCTTYSETAWAANDEIEGDEEGTIQFVDSKSWATYFEYTVECCTNLPEVINGDFELPNVGDGWGTFTSVPGWTIANYDPPNAEESPQLELQKNVNGWTIHDGQYAELDSYDPTCISQEIDTCPSAAYTITFWYSPRPGVEYNRLKVYWEDSEVWDSDNIDGSGLIDTNWQKAEIQVSASSSSAWLKFCEVGPDDQLGMFIDDISVDFTPAP